MNDWTLDVNITDAGKEPEAGVVVSVEPLVRHPLVSGNTIVYSPRRAKTDRLGLASLTVASIAGMVWKVKVEGEEVARIPDPGESQTVKLADWTLPAGPVSVNASMALLKTINDVRVRLDELGTPQIPAGALERKVDVVTYEAFSKAVQDELNELERVVVTKLNQPVQDMATVTLTNAEYIDTKAGEVFHLTYTDKTVVSINPPGRTSFIAVVEGYTNITWDAVTVHGGVDAAALVWGTFVWDSKGWHLFADTAVQKSTAPSVATLPEITPDEMSNLTNVSHGIYTLCDQDAASEMTPSISAWSNMGIPLDPKAFQVKAPINMVVEEGVVPEGVFDNNKIAPNPVKRCSPVASQNWVNSNFLPMSLTKEGNGGIDKQYLQNLPDLINEMWINMDGKQDMECVPLSLVRFDGHHMFVGSTLMGSDPVSKTDGTPLSDGQDAFPGTAYHTGLDKMVMWSPKSKSWRNLDGTPL